MDVKTMMRKQPVWNGCSASSKWGKKRDLCCVVSIHS